ncbi:tectonic-1 isoform X2 [Pelobates cultripes]|uniref:Tectonic-1 isoform X2 n=1 Tax=Pelobates cultripes TaxID=61616 RepID=A0AAD1W0P1_PELCU|nr:tectonic-1 isoform X2 [Pelobates cultripes]
MSTSEVILYTFKQESDHFLYIVMGTRTYLSSSVPEIRLLTSGTRRPLTSLSRVARRVRPASQCNLTNGSVWLLPKRLLSYSETAFCQLAADVVLNVLRDQQFPQYVASFGNSQPQNVLDWVPIVDVTALTPTEVNTCKMPVSLELEVRWTKYGSLVNPQAQIVNVTQKITYNAIPTAFLGSEKLVQIFCSVTFVDVSASAEPGYKAQPTFDAKLPFDFFYPFV